MGSFVGLLFAAMTRRCTVGQKWFLEENENIYPILKIFVANYSLKFLCINLLKATTKKIMISYLQGT